MDGLVDGGRSCNMDIKARLQAVLDRREARRTSPSRFVARPPIHIDSKDYRRAFMTGNVLGWVDTEAKVHFLQIPSLLKGIPEKSWTISSTAEPEIEFARQTFLADPSQDLLVVTSIDW